jgi:pimeloyl-ACP methyl ester carboxylesterase
MGGSIAMEMALRQPRLVRSLTLACTWAEGDGRFLHTLESWISLAHRVPIEERDRQVLYPWLFTPEYGLPYQTKTEAIADRQGGIMAWNGTRLAKLGGVRVPTLVLVGKDDILTPPAFSRQVARAIRRARLVVMPGGHGFFLEHADQFNRTLLRFLKSVRST